MSTFGTADALRYWWHRAQVAEAEVKAMRAFLAWLSTYEKNPPEIMKDDFAYDRLLDWVHESAKNALEPMPGPGDALDTEEPPHASKEER